MDSKKCKPSKGVASSMNVVPLSVPKQEDEMARSLKDMVAVKSNVDIDLREVYFLILHFLSAGPCQRSFVQLRNELLEHRLLPRRYHAWFSRSGEPGEDDADDDDGISLPLDYNNLMDRYPHIAKDHLVKLMKQLMPSTTHPLNGKHGGSSPNAADVPTLLGDGSFSLLDIDRKTTAKQVKRPPLYMRWPHLKANQVQGLSLREIGGGFTKHHRAPSVQSACYAIAKPSTMVQKMQNIKKLRGHRVAVYCAILDGSGRYVISGSDDRLVKIWSMETAFCLASCRGHDGDITDLAVSSNNALVASASNDYSIRVWRLPDGMPISVLRGHGGAVNTIAFSPRPTAVYQLLSSSDDGTCRIWDARNSQNPCIYVPRPSDAITGKGNAPSANLPSSSNAQPELQILCCAYNANGTVFVTGSSDTFARVWSAPKPNTDNSELPIHEVDLLSGHENDVNYVQFSGCAVSSKIWTSDSWKEENTPKFRNFWYSHDNIVTCSRDGSAIIWVPRSRRSHGKVGRWIRAYHLKVPTPPLPPQPPRGGPRQRVLPTPRGVNMIVWSLDNRFVLAAIMDCRICVWNAVDGSLVHSLTGHTESSYVLDVHPFNPRIAMSAGYDGRTIVWDIWEGIPIRTYEIGRFRLVDGKFSPDGTSIVLSDDVGQIYFLSTGQGESQKDAKYDQFFLGDYRPLIQDTQGNILDQETQLPPHRRNIQEPLCDSSMIPYPEPYQSQFQRRRLGALGIEWRPSLIKYAIGPDFSVGQDYQVIPLADLEGVLDPQPEFLDALLWEPEYDIVSDDNDSEYNVNEDNSSAAEQGTISAISSSDIEYSESDSNNKDGLRRSRRKSHNIVVEGMTSGRRVRKRNLEECNGNTSGNNKVKKSKGSLKSAKKKPSKAKTSRPRRTAAHNARNMFSHIGETSTEGEDNYSEDESSDSFQDSENLSEPESKVHIKREELKKAPLEKSANASKPPPYSDSQTNLESRPRLVLKFSLSKKNVPLEDARFARENQSDMVCQSSTPQPLESVQKTLPDTYGMSDTTNANLPESHNRNENVINHLDTSICLEESTGQSRQMRKPTYDLSISGDALLTDTEINGHPEFSANGKSEHMNSKLKTDSSMVNIELSDFDNTANFSSLESWGLDNHQPIADGPIASGYDKLNGGYKGQSKSDKCTEDLQENDEFVHSSHSQDLKMKAPLKATKIVIKKKQPLEDIEGPSKLKFGSSKADSIGTRNDVISGNPSFTGPDRLPEALEGGDGRSTSYPQLPNSYSDQRSYNHVHERNKSYKREPNPNGFGLDLEENASVYSNQHSLGIDLSKVGSDPIRRTRSIRMKKTYEEPDALNERIIIRGGQSSRGTSSREGSSFKVSDELHQRTRSARNRSDEYIANDPGILAQSMPNYHVKKLSWLMLSEKNAMCALANISGGLSYVISSLESCSSPTQIADTLGAITSALMIYDNKAESTKPSDPLVVEETLLKQFKPRFPFLVLERAIEALASLYGNSVLSTELANSDAKRLLVGLITMAANEVQDELIKALLTLCKSEGSLWRALQGREGVQLLISLLGLSSEQQQECAVALLCLLSNENDESKWAITAAGGIPPLVQILETGSAKAKEDSARILKNLCNHSEDIRACVESADAVPALLWLLKNGSPNGKDIAAKTINHLIHKSDTTTISQLTALLTSDLPDSKVYILDALRSMLCVAPLSDILREGSASGDAFNTVIMLLSSNKEETQAKSASALAEIFEARKDLRESSIAVRTLCSAMKLLNVESESILMESSNCMASIFLSIKENKDVAAIARDTLTPLVALANSSVLEVAEMAIGAVANLILDTEIAKKVVLEEVILPATRVLREGTNSGKTRAAAAIARLLHSQKVDNAVTDCVNRAGTVLALVSSLDSSVNESVSTSEALEALAILSRSEETGGNVKPACAILAEFPQNIIPIVLCIVNSTPSLQDKTIEILSRLCKDQPVILGDTVASASGCISSIAKRVISSSNVKVKIGGVALLICAAKPNHRRLVENINISNLSANLIQSLVDILISAQSSFGNDGDDDDKEFISICRRTQEEANSRESNTGTSIICGVDLAIWLLSILACHDERNKIAIMKAGAIDVLADKISNCYSQYSQTEYKEDSSMWICALLLAILFQDRDIIRAHSTIKSLPALATLLKSDESANKYFAAQSIASLVCNGSRGTLLSVANSGAAGGLISLLGRADTDMQDLLELSEEFALVRYPDQVALERLFRVDDIRVGATSRKAIPALVDLLKPIPGRPGAPFLALGILTQLGRDCPSNKTVMVESGALEALTKYLSLGPQDATEEAATDLLGILFSSADIRKHDSAFGAVNQLIAVLRLGGRAARFSAAKALESLFSADHIRNAEIARQAIQPLVEILNTGSEREQHAAIAALVGLLSENPSRALAAADVEMNAVDVLYRILSSNCSIDLIGDAAELCCALFGNTRIRSTTAATRCVEPLVALLATEFSPAHHSVVRALDRLVDDEQVAELIATHSAVVPLVSLLSGRNFVLHEAISRALVKLGKDRPACKMEMVKAGVIESILDILHEAPDFLCAAFAELLRILTNNATIAKGPLAAKVVEPLFLLLARHDFAPDGQHSAMQVLVNIVEHPQCRAEHSLTSRKAIEPLIPLLDSPISVVQQLAAELLSHLLLEEHFQKDPVTPKVIAPLIRILSSGIPLLQQRAVKALVSIALTWPNEIAKEGGVVEISKVILQADPSLPHALWESAASVLSSILQFSSEFYLEVPVAVLVKLLRSGSESTVIGALNALLVLESDDGTSAESMAESGAIEALLELLRSHQCEDIAARLLEVLLNNVKIRETKVTKSAILPLSQYLLDPQTQAQHARLLATLALGDLFQNEALARTGDAVSACRALVNVLEDQPTEEMKVVAICALQNLVMYNRSNRRAVAEAGGVQVVLDLIGSSNPETSVQAAMFIKLLFSNNTIQEYASSETVRAITATIEKDLWASGTVNEEYLKALNSLFSNFPRLRATEPATLSIPHLVTSLKTGSEACQEAALDALFLLRQAWSACPAEVSRAQSIAAADAIPFLQYLIQSGPPRFQEKAEFLLQCLPGTLVVIVKRGNNMKQSVGVPSVYCKITLGHNPPRLTKVVSTGPNPEWDESFTWSFESPPKGQKLHISCKNKSKVGKSKFGKVTIQIDRVVMLGAVAGEYTLLPASKSGPPRNLEIEFQWSNKASDTTTDTNQP